MKIEIIPNSTECIRIITIYNTTLKIDDNYETKVKIEETLTNLNNPEKLSSDIDVIIAYILLHIEIY